MDDKMRSDFLRKRMVELRNKNGLNQTKMAEKLGEAKSTISRVENGRCKYKTVHYFAECYCDAFNMTSQQKELFLRGTKVVVADTSALLKNEQLLDELSKEYSKVIVPEIVVNELDKMKNRGKKAYAAKAWRILQSITNNAEKNVGNIITYPYQGKKEGLNNDQKIIEVALAVAIEFNCEVDLITNDTDFTARLSGRKVPIEVVFLPAYLATKQALVNMDALMKLNKYYGESYENLEKRLDIPALSKEELNAYLPPADENDMAGYTMIISAVRNKKATFKQRSEKIRWLIAHGADVNKRDNCKYYLPALSHAIQKNDFEMFCFLLQECNANPNVGSRNPEYCGKIRQKNDGNMPLMIAAWSGRVQFVKELCADPRISINQQDGNGFTALMKACHWGYRQCREILIAAGADQKIVDREGLTAQNHYDEAFETGRNKQEKEINVKND